MRRKTSSQKLTVDFIADCGAVSHGVPGEGYLDAGSAYPSKTNLTVVGGGKLRSEFRGDVTLSSTVNGKTFDTVLKDVIAIPGGVSFLLSVGKLDRLGWKITTKRGLMRFYPPKSRFHTMVCTMFVQTVHLMRWWLLWPKR